LWDVHEGLDSEIFWHTGYVTNKTKTGGFSLP
jgi:hypothetical protein